MHAFTNDNVFLLILDLGNQVIQLSNLAFEGVLVFRVVLGDVDDAVDIEADDFVLSVESRVEETVGEFAVTLGDERVFAHCLTLDLVELGIDGIDQPKLDELVTPEIRLVVDRHSIVLV